MHPHSRAEPGIHAGRGLVDVPAGPGDQAHRQFAQLWFVEHEPGDRFEPRTPIDPDSGAPVGENVGHAGVGHERRERSELRGVRDRAHEGRAGLVERGRGRTGDEGRGIHAVDRKDGRIDPSRLRATRALTRGAAPVGGNLAPPRRHLIGGNRWHRQSGFRTTVPVYRNPPQPQWEVPDPL